MTPSKFKQQLALYPSPHRLVRFFLYSFLLCFPALGFTANECLLKYSDCNDQNWQERKRGKSSCDGIAEPSKRASCLNQLKPIWEQRDRVCKNQRSQCLSSREQVDSGFIPDLPTLDAEEVRRQEEYDRAQRDYRTSVRLHCKALRLTCSEEAARIAEPNLRTQANSQCYTAEMLCVDPSFVPIDCEQQSDAEQCETSFINLLKSKLREHFKPVPNHLEKAIRSVGTGVRG